MSTSHSEVVIDHEGDLSPSQEPVLFLGFLFLEANLLLNWGFWMILFRAEAIFASSISKFGKFFPITDREDFSSSKESTISTSLIHNIASDGKSEPFETCVLNRVFHTKNDAGVGNLSNCNSDICCLCCPTTQFCGNSTSIVELVVNGLDAKVGIGIVPQFCPSPLVRLAFPLGWWSDEILRGKSKGESNVES